MTQNCPTTENNIAHKNEGLLKGDISKKHLSDDRQAYALKRSQLTNVINVMVVSLRVTCPSSSSTENTQSVKNMITAALLIARVRRARVTMGSETFLGGARKTLSSTGSTPKLWAGGPSVELGRQILQKITCLVWRRV